MSSIRMKMKFGLSEALRQNGMIRKMRNFLNIMICIPKLGELLES
jgi:hypothetical protein